MAIQCVTLTDHVTLNFNKHIPPGAVFLDIAQALIRAWHPVFLYKLSKLRFSENLRKLISSFLTNRKFRVCVEGELSRAREIQAGVPQVSVLAPTLCKLYINEVHQTTGGHVTLFTDNMCLYAIGRKEGYVLRKLQRGLTAMAAWCQRWNIKIREEKTQAICFCQRRGPINTHLTLKR
jgi:hypothetical protein